MPVLDTVVEALPADHRLVHAVMDRGDDSDHIRATLENNHLTPVIPPKKNRPRVIDDDQAMYKLREKVERFFAKLTQFRRIATRDEKLGSTFLAFIHLTASCMMTK
jgi:transposase